MKVVWCLGLYASASTWLFNVVRQMSAAKGPVFTYFTAGDIAAAAFERNGTHIVKSHEIGDAEAAAWLDRRAERIFVTVRDPRDSVSSLILYHGFEFARALEHVDQAARLCASFAGDPRSLLLPYESGFCQNPEGLQKIASHLGLALGEAARNAIFAGLQRQAVESHIAKLPSLPGVLQDRVSGDMLDPQTHWHTHHAGRTGEIGRWRQVLSAAQAEAIEAKLQGCFTFGT
jgi:hypothetical protein